MEELLKVVNVFLSVYNLRLSGSLEDNMVKASNLEEILVVDKEGTVVGIFKRVDDKKSTINVMYGLEGDLQAEIISHVIPYKDSTYRPHIISYKYGSYGERGLVDNLSNFEGTMIINNVGKKGKIDFYVRNNICAKYGFKPKVEVDNGMNDYLYRINVPCSYSSLALGIYSRETVFSYENSDGSHLRIEKSNHDVKQLKSDIHLLVDYFYYCDGVRSHMSPKFDVENPDLKSIDDIYKAAKAIDGRFYETIEDARELLTIAGIHIFYNLASLCSHKLSDEELKLMYGYNPRELKGTPVLGHNGEVMSPKNKVKQKIKG
jgi:hypothetical protein